MKNEYFSHISVKNGVRDECTYVNITHACMSILLNEELDNSSSTRVITARLFRDISLSHLPTNEAVKVLFVLRVSRSLRGEGLLCISPRFRGIFECKRRILAIYSNEHNRVARYAAEPPCQERYFDPNYKLSLARPSKLSGKNGCAIVRKRSARRRQKHLNSVPSRKTLRVDTSMKIKGTFLDLS